MVNTKEIWRHLWLVSFNELTSLELQKNSWLNISNDSYHRSFAGFISHYFEDVLWGFDYQFFINEEWLTKKEFEIIKDWHTELVLYVPPNNDELDDFAILNDKEWRSIVRFGMFTRQKLMIFIPGKEKEYLTDTTLPRYSHSR